MSIFPYCLFVALVCEFSARGPDTGSIINFNENTVLVFENVDLNVCGGYDNTTGNVTLLPPKVVSLSRKPQHNDV